LAVAARAMDSKTWAGRTGDHHEHDHDHGRDHDHHFVALAQNNWANQNNAYYSTDDHFPSFGACPAINVQHFHGSAYCGAPRKTPVDGVW
jgi:hypothetical protein